MGAVASHRSIVVCQCILVLGALELIDHHSRPTAQTRLMWVAEDSLFKHFAKTCALTRTPDASLLPFARGLC